MTQALEINGVDPDILAMAVDVEHASRLMRLRLLAASIVKDAANSDEGLERLGKVMAVSNDIIESGREDFEALAR